jgi:hypothetical protein
MTAHHQQQQGVVEVVDVGGRRFLKLCEVLATAPRLLTSDLISDLAAGDLDEPTPGVVGRSVDRPVQRRREQSFLPSWCLHV